MAYDTQPVHAAVMQRNATPIIAPRKNARMRKGDAFVHRNAAIAACRRFGRKLWKILSGYHRRSLVETKMNCIKRLGERVMSRTFEPPFSIGLLKWGARKRRLGLGKAGLGLIYAATPLAG